MPESSKKFITEFARESFGAYHLHQVLGVFTDTMSY